VSEVDGTTERHAAFSVTALATGMDVHVLRKRTASHNGECQSRNCSRKFANMSGVPSIPESILDQDKSRIPLDQHNLHSTDLHDGCIENFRRLRVAVIGAGFSGIDAAIRVSERLRNIDLVVYEKNADVGGTWYENTYPGCACDVPGETMTSPYQAAA
jgi:hypothetical protein